MIACNNMWQLRRRGTEEDLQREKNENENQNEEAPPESTLTSSRARQIWKKDEPHLRGEGSDRLSAAATLAKQSHVRRIQRVQMEVRTDGHPDKQV